MCPLGDGRLTRRCLLRRALHGGAGIVVLGSMPLLASCTRNDAPPRPRVEYDRLLAERRIVILDNEIPVELVHREGRIQARSLLCTHQGCVVAWDPEARRYLCPCHDGVYDADGNPLLGPPELPLRRFPVEREGDFIYVDTRPDGDTP